MDITRATVTLRSTSPLTQSRKHDSPQLEGGESPEAWDIRTWRQHMHVRTFGGKQEVVIPAPAMQQCLAAGAKYLNRKIPGQRNATWTKHFVAGIAIMGDIRIGQSPDDCRCQVINAHADGKRTSGSRVTRRLPTFDEWEATFEVSILDNLINKDIFHDVVEAAGLFVGIGQFRPENGGINGRWEIEDIEWNENRQPQKKVTKR